MGKHYATTCRNNYYSCSKKYGLGSQVSVQGIVTSGETLGSGRFVQDATGGISSFGGDVSNFMIGDEVVITGELSEYNGLLQVSPVSSSEVLSTGNDLPAPMLITVVDINEANEGMLTTIEDVTFADAGGTFESANYEISDATGVSTIYLRFSNPLVGTAIPNGETDITGIVGQFNDHQLLPRDVADLEGGGTTNPPTGDEIPIGEARTTALGETVTIKGIVTNGDELGIIRYVQDETGGIACYPGTGSVDGFPDVMPGDEVLLTGVLKDYNGLLEIDPIESYEVVSSK